MNKLIREVEVRIDGGRESIRVERRSEKIYYCLESLVFTELNLYGCEIEIKSEGDKLVFVRVHKESDYSTHIYAWSKDFLESESGIKIKERIVKVGGDWEQVMGGILFIHLPKEKAHLIGELIKTAE